MVGYTIYELLSTLIHRVAWPNQAEMQAALDSVEGYQQVNLFGNMASLIECTHDESSRRNLPRGNSVCLDCGRIVA